MTALLMACESGHLDVAKFLLTNGANISATNNVRTTVTTSMCTVRIIQDNITRGRVLI